MAKNVVRFEQTTVKKMVKEFHRLLKRYGLKQNNIAAAGSFLNGNYEKESDFDLIIISNSFEDKNQFERIDMTIKAETDLRKRFFIPMNILLKTPDEYEKSTNQYFDCKVIV